MQPSGARILRRAALAATAAVCGAAPLRAATGPQGFVLVSGGNMVTVTDGALTKLDPATNGIAAQVSFSTTNVTIASDLPRRLVYAAASDGKLSVFKADTLERADIAVSGLGLIPIGSAVTPDGRTLLLTTRGSDGLRNADDRLDVVSLSTGSWPPTASLSYSVPTGTQPINVMVDHAGRYAVVTVRDDPAVLVLDLGTRQTVLRAAMPFGSEPEGLDMHPTQNVAYALNHGANTIEVLDLTQDPPQFVASVPVWSSFGNPQPSKGKFTPDGRRLFVSAQTINRVLLFDTSVATSPVQDKTVSLPVGPQPHGIVFLPDGRAYVANTNNGGANGSISVLQNVHATPSVSGGQILSSLVGPNIFLSFVIDSSSPSVPAGLTAAAAGSSRIELSWTASTDDMGLAGYKVYRDGVWVATPTTNSYADDNLSPSQTCAYAVAAYDAAGNVSAQSAAASATTFVSSSALLNSLDADGFLWGTEAGVSLLDYANLGSTVAAVRDVVNDTFRTKFVKIRPSMQGYSSSDGGLTYSPAVCLPSPVNCIDSFNMDETVKLFKANGWSMVPMLSHDTSKPTVSSADIDLYVNFVDWFVGRYKTDASIRYVELVNDPARWWNGTATQLLELNNKAYDRLKAKYPEVLIGTPGFEYWSDTLDADTVKGLSQVDAFLDPANGARFDFWAFHGYPLREILGPQSLVSYPPTRTAVNNTYAGIPGILEIRARLDANGWQARGIIDAEHFGVLPVGSTIQDSGDVLEAAYMVQELLLKRTLRSPSGDTALSGALALKLRPRGAAAEDTMGSLFPDGSPAKHVKAVALLWSKLDEYNHVSRVSGAFDDEGTAWVEKFQSTTTRKELYIFFKPFNYTQGASIQFDGTTAGYSLSLGRMPLSVVLTGIDGSTSAVTASPSLALAATNSPQFLEVTYGPPDVSSPTVPVGLAATAAGSAQINLSWTASTDDVAVAGYKVYRDGVWVATPTTNSYADDNLSPSQTCAYAVAAYDAAGNVSAQSAAASATTTGANASLTNSLDADGFLWGTEGAVGVSDYASIGSTAAAARAAINDALKTKYVKFRLQSSFFSSSDGGLTYSAVYCMPYPSQCMASGNVDETVKLFKANGWSMIPMLSYDPSDSNVTSAKIDVFVNFVDWFLGRYKSDGDIQFLELQNSPSSFWQGTDAQLLELTNKVYDRVKAGHPGVLVGTPGFEYSVDTVDLASQRVDFFLNPANGAKFDFWAFHGYPLSDIVPPNSFALYPPTRTPTQNKYAGIPGILEIRKALDANGWQARRIIDTEHIGVLPVSPTFSAADDRLEAAYMAQDLTLKRALYTSSGSMALSGALPLKIEPRGGNGEFLYGSLNPDGSLSHNVRAVALLIDKLHDRHYSARVSGAFDDESQAWVEKFVSTAARKELYVFFKPFRYSQGQTVAFDGQTLSYTLTLSSLPVSAILTGLDGSASAVAASRTLALSAVNSPQFLEVDYGAAATVVTVSPSAASVVTLQAAEGTVELSLPAQSFAESVQLTLRRPAECPGASAGLSATGVCAEIVLDKPLQPAKAAALTLAYRDGDVAGLDEKKLILARYDETHRGWVPLESAADAAGNKVLGKTSHFSTFQIMQASPAGGLDGARVYPNPFRPAKGHAAVVIDGLPAGARVSIHTLRGKLVWKADASDAGMAVWPGVNQDGREAASGVYFVHVESGGRRRVLKAAVVR